MPSSTLAVAPLHVNKAGSCAAGQLTAPDEEGTCDALLGTRTPVSLSGDCDETETNTVHSMTTRSEETLILLRETLLKRQ
jgi:hypothetical protein